MSIISVQQARQYAAQAGFTGQSLNTIVAVAQAESGLNTQAINSADPNGGSFGILQINGIHFGSAWKGGVMTQQAAFDPLTSFQYAFQLSSGGTNFTPWGAFTNGSYAKFLAGQPTATPGSIPGVTPGTNVPGLTTPPQFGLPTAFLNVDWSQLLAWVTDPLRAAKMITGVLLLIVALYLSLSPDGRDAVNVAVIKAVAGEG